MNTAQDLFEDLANIYDSWLSTAMESTCRSGADLSWADEPEAFFKLGASLQETNSVSHFEQAVSELLRGVIHSTLVVFDGGTKLSEKTNLKIIDDQGHTLPINLHEEFISYLIETERLK